MNGAQQALENIVGSDAIYYRDPKFVGNALCAIQTFAFTTGIVVNIDSCGYERRYCYENASDAAAALKEYSATSIHPTGPWIKCKGKFHEIPIDILNPEFSK